MQTLKRVETDAKCLYYDRVPDPTFQGCRVRGFKSKNAYRYEHAEENVANEDKIVKRTERRE